MHIRDFESKDEKVSNRSMGDSEACQDLKSVFCIVYFFISSPSALALCCPSASSP